MISTIEAARRLNEYCKQKGLDFRQGPSVPVKGEGIYSRWYIEQDGRRVGEAINYPDGFEVIVEVGAGQNPALPAECQDCGDDDSAGVCFRCPMVTMPGR